MIVDSMKLFSKIIDTGNTQIFEQYNITRRKFESEDEIEIYDYITKFIKRNGKTPTLDEVVANCPGFFYLSSNSSFDDIVEQINSRYVKTELIRLIQGKASNADLHEKKQIT